jgi:hypothetical protein
MSAWGTELPIPNVRSSVAGGVLGEVVATRRTFRTDPRRLKALRGVAVNRVTQIVQLNNVTTKVIEEALKQLGATRRWREMSWPERWRWLRTTG